MTTDWSDDTVPWSEDNLQVAMVQKLLRMEDTLGGFTFAAGLEGMKTSKSVASRQKRMGMRAGEADLRLYFEDGVTVFVENKRGTSGGQKRGYASPEQKKRHELLKELGFEVHLLVPNTPNEAQEMIKRIVIKHTLDRGL